MLDSCKKRQNEYVEIARKLAKVRQNDFIFATKSKKNDNAIIVRG